MNVNLIPNTNGTNVNLQPNITGANVNITKGATQSDLFNAVNNAKLYRDESESFSIVSENKSIESTNSALNASISATTAGDKATIATTKAAEASNSASSASASETVCIAKATIATDKADIATAQAVISTDKASEASTSASTATTQAGIATTKASEASTSASNALASANNADTSEANALTYRNQAEAFANSLNTSDIVHISGTETITGDKTFTGTVSGITKSMIGLSNVDNTADSAKNVLYATTAGTASASDVYAWAKASVKPTYTASEVGLGNVTNESKATMFTNPTFTGTVTLPSTTSIGTISNTELSYLDGVTSAIQTQINSKASNSDIVNITSDQTVAGIKTFTSFPITPSASPTTNYQVANKKYVDDKTVNSSETTKGIVELATTGETQTGTDDSKVITPLKLKNSVIGLGQTWQDVSGSRSAGVIYTNTTGKPIQLAVTITSGGNTIATITVGTSTFSLRYAGTQDEYSPVFPIVPNGATYSISGGRLIMSWHELR